ncbi:MAG: hypothetical protein ACRCTA_06085, partial [Bacilli bacterium]
HHQFIPLSESDLNSVKMVDVSKYIGNPVLVPFMSAIAMGIMYGSLFAVRLTNTSNPSYSSSGQRLVISPFNRYKLALIDSLLVSVFVTLIGFVIYFYVDIVLGVNISGNLGITLGLFALSGILVSFFGQIAANIFSRFSTLFTMNILTLIFLVMSFLSGMMMPITKLLIEENFPILHKLNPLYLITDIIYNLRYNLLPDANSIIATDFVNLGIITLLLGIVSLILLRRNKI